MSERFDTRILGAVEFVDAITRQPLSRPVKITSQEIRFRRNRSGRYVVVGATGVTEAFTQSFPDPAAAPTVGSLTRTASVEDPGGEYLPRVFNLKLPRDPDPANAASAESIFRPVAVPLFPTPARAADPNWSLIRITVRDAAAPKPHLTGAIVRVTRAADPKIDAAGITDRNGECVVAIPGVPFFVVNAEGTEVVAKSLDAELKVFVHKQGKASLPEDVVAAPADFASSPAKTVKVAAASTLTEVVEVNLA